MNILDLIFLIKSKNKYRAVSKQYIFSCGTLPKNTEIYACG